LVPGRLVIDDVLRGFEQALVLQVRGDAGRAEGLLDDPDLDVGGLGAPLIKPDLVEAHNSLGSGLNAEGQHDAAIAEFKEAIRLKPDFAEAHNNLGSALEAEGQRDAGITEYKEAIRLKPDDAKAHYDLGSALEAEGQRAAATAEYKEAARLKRDLATAH
jgi:tetratricopeptide (TPR) repeat protein